jgi:hypothetical protein
LVGIFKIDLMTAPGNHVIVTANARPPTLCSIAGPDLPEPDGGINRLVIFSVVPSA